MVMVKLRCDYIQKLSRRRAWCRRMRCGARGGGGGGGRGRGGGEAEKGKGAMFSLRSNISCEEGSTSWAGGEESVCGWGGSSSPCIPEGRNPHLDYFNLQFLCLNNPIMPLTTRPEDSPLQSSTCAAPERLWAPPHPQEKMPCDLSRRSPGFIPLLPPSTTTTTTLLAHLAGRQSSLSSRRCSLLSQYTGREEVEGGGGGRWRREVEEGGLGPGGVWVIITTHLAGCVCAISYLFGSGCFLQSSLCVSH